MENENKIVNGSKPYCKIFRLGKLVTKSLGNIRGHGGV
jgi:hypothetical protein